MATPLEIDIALWYYAREGDYGTESGDYNFDAPAVQDALQNFVAAGLLKEQKPHGDVPQKFRGTGGLQVYVDALCAVPWPEQHWTIPPQSKMNRGIKGGQARAAALSPERRSEIASAAANTRWNGR